MKFRLASLAGFVHNLYARVTRFVPSLAIHCFFQPELGSFLLRCG